MVGRDTDKILLSIQIVVIRLLSIKIVPLSDCSVYRLLSIKICQYADCAVIRSYCYHIQSERMHLRERIQTFAPGTRLQGCGNNPFVSAASSA